MAWESRGSRLYYYTARREGKRVVKNYIQPIIANEVAFIEQDRMEMRAEAAEEQRQAKAELAALETALAPLNSYADAVAAGAMLAAGYHRHNCGEWRKRRHV
jgi:hypothetical protein